MSWIVLATEDELSEQVGLTLSLEAGLNIGQQLRRGGNGYLRSRIKSFCEMALFQPVLVITDLDRQRCPTALIADWLDQLQQPPDFLFRVAVREIEAWLLADHEAARKLLGKTAKALPRNPDSLQDPKRTLLNLARSASQEVRADLLPTAGAIASQGLGYNSRLCEYVRTMWDPERAAALSSSLRRTRQRLRELSDRLK